MYQGDQHTNYDASHGICSTAGSQLEQDFQEALRLMAIAVNRPDLTGRLSWHVPFEEFLKKNNHG